MISSHEAALFRMRQDMRRAQDLGDEAEAEFLADMLYQMAGDGIDEGSDAPPVVAMAPDEDAEGALEEVRRG